MIHAQNGNPMMTFNFTPLTPSDRHSYHINHAQNFGSRFIITPTLSSTLQHMQARSNTLGHAPTHLHTLGNTQNIPA